MESETTEPRADVARLVAAHGGGLRGVGQVAMWELMDDMLPGWRDNVELWIGTSAGGLNALGMAAGLTPADMVQVYKDEGPRIFSDSFWDDLGDLGILNGAQYGLDGLCGAMQDIFGTARFGDLKLGVAVTTFQLDKRTGYGRTWKPKVYHNYPSTDNADQDELVWKAAVKTAAAPVYFPAFEKEIDGGVWAGDPSLAGLGLLADYRNTRNIWPLHKVRLMSFGTGRWLEYKEVDDPVADLGLKGWNVDLVKMPLAGGIAMTEFLCDKFLGGNYLIWNPLFPQAWGMDDLKAIDPIVRFVQSQEGWIGSTMKLWVDNVW